MTDGSLRDETQRVRDEDAFDVERVAGWLREHSEEPWRARLSGIPEVRQYPGGASNLTYSLRYPDADLVLRRPPTGTKPRGAHDMGREHRIQRAVAPSFPLAMSWVSSRALRLADGPDEVHRGLIARLELGKHR